MGYEVEVDKPKKLLDIDKIAKEELFKASVRAMNTWKDNLTRGEGLNNDRQRGWVNTGEGRESITVDPQREGSEIYRVGSDKIQVAVAETGAVPHYPPYEPIADWVNEQADMPNKGDDDFYISVRGVQESIAESGIEGFAPGRLAAKKVREKLSDNVRERVKRELKEIEK